MKKLLLLLLLIPFISKAQTPVQITQPYNFTKYVLIKNDTVWPKSTITNYVSTHGVIPTDNILHWNSSSNYYTPFSAYQSNGFYTSGSFLNYGGLLNAERLQGKDSVYIKANWGGTWGSIPGDINDQTDLITILGNKLDIASPLSSSNYGFTTSSSYYGKDNAIIYSSGGMVNQFAYNGYSIGDGGGTYLSLMPLSSNPSIPYELYTKNKINGILFKLGNQNRLKFSVDSAGNVNIPTGSTYQVNGVPIGSGTTYTGNAPINVSGSVISADTGYHKNALSSFYLHQKDSTLAASKLSPNGNGSSLTGITASQVGAATNAAIHDSIEFLKPSNIAYSTTITFNKALTIMAGKTLATDDVLTIAANPVEGSSVEVVLIGNGTNTLTSSAFNYQSGSFDNTNGTVNFIVMHYANGKSHIWFKTEALIH